MTALTADTKLYQWGTPDQREKLSFPVAASTTVYGNSIAVTNSSGQLINTGQDQTCKAWGLIDRQVVNVTACALDAEVNQGIFWVPQCAAGDLAEADIGATVYVWDNITVGKGSAGSTKCSAGKLVAVNGVGSLQGAPAGYVAVAFGLVGGVI
jgi:hypothetical protein